MMKFLYGLYGANVPVIREFEISEKENVQAGELITISTDGVISKNAVGPAVGVAAEDHSGEKDILNPRSDGNKLRINVTGGGVYSVPAIRLCAAKSGNATTFICDGSGLNTNLVNAKLVLVSKGENSINTDSAGTERKITNVAISSGTATITLENGGETCIGDVYALIPMAGYTGDIANDCKSFTCASGKGVELLVMGYDKNTLTLEVLIKTNFFD